MSLGLVALIVSALTLAWTVGWSVYTHRPATRPNITLRASWGIPVYDLPGGAKQVW
jgi:hypothetical protein